MQYTCLLRLLSAHVLHTKQTQKEKRKVETEFKFNLLTETLEKRIISPERYFALRPSPVPIFSVPTTYYSPTPEANSYD